MFAYAAMAKLVDLAHQTIEEIAVVAHHDERSVEVLQGLLEHILGLEVEVVGGLVEDKQVHGLQQELENGQSGALSAR